MTTLTATNQEKTLAGKRESSASLWKQIVPFALVFLAACTVFFWQLGSAPLFSPDEGLYAEPAREMLDTGEYITTLLNYKVRFTKPPLCIWAMAMSYLAFGVNEFAARFFGAALGALTVAATYLFINRYASTRAAVFGSLALLSAPLFVGVGRCAITDVPLSFLIAGALMSFYHAFNQTKKFWLWTGYVLTGLAVMVKGPVGVVLPAAIVFAYHLLRRNLRQAWHFYNPFAGAAIIGAISLPWFILEIAITKGAYFQEFIMRENFQRFTSVVDSHKGAWWYHIAAMLGGFFPWSMFLPFACARAASRSDRSPETKPAGINYFKDTGKRQDLMLFALLWASITLGFFSISVSKLIPYTLPAFPALAVLIACEIDSSLKKNKLIRLVIPVSLLAIIYGGAGIVAPMLLTKLRNAPPDLFELVGGYITLQCLIIGVSCALLIFRRPQAALASFAGLTVLSSVFFGLKALNSVSTEWEGPLPAMANYAAVSDYPIFVFDLRKPTTPFYTRRQVIEPGSWQSLDELTRLFKNGYVISKASNREKFLQIPGYRIVSEKGKFLLVEWRRPAS